jgi:hypothetical protein
MNTVSVPALYRLTGMEGKPWGPIEWGKDTRFD